MDGVGLGATARLDLHHDAELVVDGVNLVGDAFGPMGTEQDRTADAGGARLASLDLVAEGGSRPGP